MVWIRFDNRGICDLQVHISLTVTEMPLLFVDRRRSCCLWKFDFKINSSNVVSLICPIRRNWTLILRVRSSRPDKNNIHLQFRERGRPEKYIKSLHKLALLGGRICWMCCFNCAGWTVMLCVIVVRPDSFYLLFRLVWLAFQSVSAGTKSTFNVHGKAS